MRRTVASHGQVLDKPKQDQSFTRQSVRHLERRTVLGPGLAVVVDAGGGDVGVPQPLLHLGDVGLVVQGIGRRGCAQRVGADLEPSAPE